VVCGHIHHAEIRTIDGILYCNDGDWVESCTALVEDFDGRLRIVRWAEEVARRDTMLPRLAPVRLAAE
jgi:UDP-2,3-diacylglucosamine pyrophosphatase LpxH